MGLIFVHKPTSAPAHEKAVLLNREELGELPIFDFVLVNMEWRNQTQARSVQDMTEFLLTGEGASLPSPTRSPSRG